MDSEAGGARRSRGGGSVPRGGVPLPTLDRNASHSLRNGSHSLLSSWVGVGLPTSFGEPKDVKPGSPLCHFLWPSGGSGHAETCTMGGSCAAQGRGCLGGSVVPDVGGRAAQTPGLTRLRGHCNAAWGQRTPSAQTLTKRHEQALLYVTGCWGCYTTIDKHEQ